MASVLREEGRRHEGVWDLYYRVRVMGAPARRRWLPLLGSAGRRVEGRVRNGALRLLRRVTGAEDVDI